MTDLLKKRTDELKRISLMIKCEILKKPGLTSNEIINLLPDKRHLGHLATTAIRIMRDTGTIIVRNGKYYVLCPSVMVKAKRYRQKERERLVSTETILNKTC